MMAELLHQLAWGKNPPKYLGGDLPKNQLVAQDFLFVKSCLLASNFFSLIFGSDFQSDLWSSKRPLVGWVTRKGTYTQLYRDYFISHYKDPYSPTNGRSTGYQPSVSWPPWVALLFYPEVQGLSWDIARDLVPERSPLVESHFLFGFKKGKGCKSQ